MFTKRLLNSILINKTFKPIKCQRRGGAGWYQPFRSGSKKIEDERNERWEQLSEWDKFSGGIQTLKQELKLWAQEVRDGYSLDSTFNSYENQEIVKYWDFDQNNNNVMSSVSNDNFETNDMNRWRTSCDSDNNEGYSTCSWTVSPTGRALFSGYTDTKLPLDGKIARAGWCFVGCEKHRKSFFRQNHFDWFGFTHLLVRCRGDGRNYFIVLNVSDDRADITWFDRYQYVLYTHGGPYWQWCKIPFSKFYFQHKGYAQETQFIIPKDRISQIGFMLMDQNTGPFNLEIDYIGCMRDDNWTDETAYETYFHKENKYLSPGTT